MRSSLKHRLSTAAFVSYYDIAGSPLQVITRSLRRVSGEQIMSNPNAMSKQVTVNTIPWSMQPHVTQEFCQSAALWPRYLFRSEHATEEPVRTTVGDKCRYHRRTLLDLAWVIQAHEKQASKDLCTEMRKHAWLKVPWQAARYKGHLGQS